MILTSILFSEVLHMTPIALGKLFRCYILFIKDWNNSVRNTFDVTHTLSGNEVVRILGPLPASQLTRDIVRKTFFYLLKYNHGFLSP